MKYLIRPLLAMLAAGGLLWSSWSLTGHGAALEHQRSYLRIGLAYGGMALAWANLENNTGYGAGYRFGQLSPSGDWKELGQTSPEETRLTMLKTQNIWVKGTGYSQTDQGGALIGCYHIQLPGSYPSYEKARAVASTFEQGFVAWIHGEYQVRVGWYGSQSAAQQAKIPGTEMGTVVGTSSYGINITPTGQAKILFQFDGGPEMALGVLPDVTGQQEVRTWFQGNRYRGMFRYERVNGGNLTVVNLVDPQTYLKGVLPYEMNHSWPVEALKAQAICARSYAYRRAQSSPHRGDRFDLCNTTHCQVYYGDGSNAASYQSNPRTDQAVEETAGEYGIWNGQVIEAVYSASHGGASESVYHVWGSSEEAYPYLTGVVDPYESNVAEKNSFSHWTVSRSATELTQRLKDRGYPVGNTLSALVLTYSQFGNVIQMELQYDSGETVLLKPEKIRSVLGLSSIRFTVTGEADTRVQQISGTPPVVNHTLPLDPKGSYWVIGGDGSTVRQDFSQLHGIVQDGEIVPLDLVPQPDPGHPGEQPGGQLPDGWPVQTTVRVTGSVYQFSGSGHGHQLGMSQYGAYAMAEQGFTYRDIIAFYFPGARVEQLS